MSNAVSEACRDANVSVVGSVGDVPEECGMIGDVGWVMYVFTDPPVQIVFK